MKLHSELFNIPCLVKLPKTPWDISSAVEVASAMSQVLLQSHAVTHLVLCGRPEKDAHVAAAQKAVENSPTELHLVELVPEDGGEVKGE